MVRWGRLDGRPVWKESGWFFDEMVREGKQMVGDRIVAKTSRDIFLNEFQTSLDSVNINIWCVRGREIC